MQLAPGQSKSFAIFLGVITLTVCSAIPRSALAQRGRRIEQLQRDLESREKELEEQQNRNKPPRPNPAEPALAAWIDQLSAVVPRSAAGFSAEKVDDFRKANDAAERWAAELVRFDNSPRA